MDVFLSAKLILSSSWSLSLCTASKNACFALFLPKKMNSLVTRIFWSVVKVVGCVCMSICANLRLVCSILVLS